MLATSLFALGLMIAARAVTVTGTLEAIAVPSTITALWTATSSLLGTWAHQRIPEPTLGILPFLEDTSMAVVPVIDVWWSLVVAAFLAKSWQRSPVVLSALIIALTLIARVFGEHAH